MPSLSADFNNMLHHAVGPEQGIDPSALQGLDSALKRAHAAMARAAKEDTLGFLSLANDHDNLRCIQRLADKVARRFDNFVVLGIGGSALGNIMLQNALKHPYHNLLSRKARGGTPRIFVEDNVDPTRLTALLDCLDLRKTCFNVITKSGGTVETMANFFIVRDRLLKAVGKKGLRDRFVVTTTLHAGALFRIAQKEGHPTLGIPGNVGGRFSVLSSVGLLSAAVAGIDIAKVCAGARAMARACAKDAFGANPALMSAGLRYLAYRQGKPIWVLMPYVQGLKDFADWYAQLSAESLGKARNRTGAQVFVGPTPVKALGVTDQHSQLQLYQEGPLDKIVTFLRVRRLGRNPRIPNPFPKEETNFLSGHTLGKLLDVEQRATELALTNANRPNMTITLSELSPKTLGMLIYFSELEIAYLGELLDIDAFNQPGVEAGKKYAYGLLGKPGFEAKRKELEGVGKPDRRYVLSLR